MSTTSVEVDGDIAAQAAAILGTTTLRDTIDASLREIVNAKRRLELVALLRDSDRYDLDTVDNAWGGDDADFELVAAVTGQPTQWIVERGTAD